MINAFKDLYKKFKIEEFGQKNIKKELEKLKVKNAALSDEKDQLKKQVQDLNQRLLKIEERLRK